jgi:hypothetical protein
VGMTFVVARPSERFVEASRRMARILQHLRKPKQAVDPGAVLIDLVMARLVAERRRRTAG